jgi:hypothetical protein
MDGKGQGGTGTMTILFWIAGIYFLIGLCVASRAWEDYMNLGDSFLVFLMIALLWPLQFVED